MTLTFKKILLSIAAVCFCLNLSNAWAQLSAVDDLYRGARGIAKYKTMNKTDFLLALRSANHAELTQIITKLPHDKKAGALLNIAQERGMLRPTDALYFHRYVNNVPNYNATLLMYVSEEIPNLYSKMLSDLKLVRNQGLAGKIHPVTNVPFNSAAFPIFKSQYAIDLPESMYKVPITDQFKYATMQLAKGIDNNPDLARIFTPRQIEQIRMGYKPTGFTWHHHETPGKMQLVDSKIHQQTGHTGGTAIWGPGGSCE